jgi:NADH:ubiquinone oxidoreductase subunit 2 (subunit N)
LLWLVALALFGSFISLYYYLIVLKAIFVDRPELAGERRLSPLTSHFSLLDKLVVSILAAAVLFLGLMPQLLVARILATLP